MAEGQYAWQDGDLMKPFDLRLSNYNYDAATFYSRVETLIERDAHWFGQIIQRTALSRTPDGQVQHVISRIDVKPKTAAREPTNTIDYGELIFVVEELSKDILLSRLSALSERHFSASTWPLVGSSIGFSDRYEPSQNEYSGWPCWVFDVSLGSVQVTHEPLLHPSLKSYPSAFAAIKEILRFGVFHDSSDARLGHILVTIPNPTARFGHISIAGSTLKIGFDANAKWDSLKLSVHYKNRDRDASFEQDLSANEVSIPLAFVPTEINLWLISRDGFIADFHQENEAYSRGANAALPKQKLPERDPFHLGEFFTHEPTNSFATGRRVFLINGHNTSVKESVARFIERLNLEAIILHEQPNQGATIIEKFELNSDVAFAIALLTADDEGHEIGYGDQPRKRARQNVIFEFGFFIGKLGRNRVCALVDGDLEIPSDYQGVVYISLDDAGNWKLNLLRELKASGLDVDANRAFEVASGA